MRRRLLGLMQVALLLLLASCSRSPDLIGINNPKVPAASVEGATVHRIFIATTREDSEAVGALFSELRADELGLASVDVSVPPTHRRGVLERPAKLPPDPRKHFAIVSPKIYANERAFVSYVDRSLATRPVEDRDILVFIHGFNTTTSDALLQVAQFVEDSGFKGVPVLFTWASAGKTSRYVYDLNSALVARPQLIEAATVLSHSIAREYHIFAHSMGAFLTMEALVDVSQQDRFQPTGRLQNIVLASPDIDVDVFKSQMEQLDPNFDRIFVLLSKDDAALRASRVIAGGVPRVGAADADAIAALGVTAIDLTEIDDSNSGSHSKFTGSPEIVQLIGSGLNSVPEYSARNRTLLDQILGDLPIQIVGAN